VLNIRWNNTHVRVALAMLNLSAWIRRRRALGFIYRVFPQMLRDRVSAALAAPALQCTRFSSLPAHVDPIGTPLALACAANPVSIPLLTKKGVNIFGYLRGQFGIGESARMYARALIAAGYPVALNDIDIDLPHGFRDSSLDGDIGIGAPYETNLIFVNPDYLSQALASIGEIKLKGRYTIACWFWELEQVPDDWRWAFDVVDEIMVASTFVAEAFRQVTQKPILRVPLPVTVADDSGVSRRDFGLPSDKFIFLTTFDFHSSIHRKNPFAVIEAFREAFPCARTDVCLLIKSTNGYQYPDNLQKLLSLAMEDSRILVRDQVLDHAHVQALQRCSDAYISLHRAEGFGLGLAECMAMGKPVIGTGWSGNLDFMSLGNSCLVNYALVPVQAGEYPHAQGARWANADIGHAAAFMRRVVDDRDFAVDLGQKGAADIRQNLSPASAARALVSRLNEIASHTEGQEEKEGNFDRAFSSRRLDCPG
jgi:hypothetical protein